MTTPHALRPLALISVSDKTALLPLAQSIEAGGMDIISTGGTASFLRERGVRVESVEGLTGCPEMLSGRVKTLHPAIFAAILARPTAADEAQLQLHSLRPISLVIVNLYPFARTVLQSGGCTPLEAVEEIDIGGVALVRAAAKNSARVAVVTCPGQYGDVIQAFRQGGGKISQLQRDEFALEAFRLTARYDADIAEYLKGRQEQQQQPDSQQQQPDSQPQAQAQAQQQLETQSQPDSQSQAQAQPQLETQPNSDLQPQAQAQQQPDSQPMPDSHCLKLRYGANPHQIPASASCASGPLPITVLSGSPGYINLLDALNAYALVAEVSQALKSPAAASFKHVSPAGVAVGHPALSRAEQSVYFASEKEAASPLASAYVRARGADRMSSFGDWIALSDKCDVPTAEFIAREVSDGVIAPGFEEGALAILRAKKKGNYTVLQMDANYVPAAIETRQVFGVNLQQGRNNAVITADMFNNVVTKKTTISPQTVRDMILANICLKYTQSNSVCYAVGGAVVGIGAGQQSRIHCTRLAGDKTDAWWMRFHERVINLPFKKTVKRVEKSNAIDLLVTGESSLLSVEERKAWEGMFERVPTVFTAEERKSHLAKIGDLVCASDAFFPFSDNVYRASRSGAKFITAPKGSVMDSEVIKAADVEGITVVHHPIRLFHH